ncbi:hypothetical protein U9M48_042521 [Paspalum notatum var. saurae]|uniref:Uncharacterized protein n=1 Tax=Paspalum notatum var. saurae TaxID=547442 RepID=A0AAQ3XHP3_PASNO
MHSGWSTTVAPGFSSPSESPHGPSEGLHHRCRTAPLCTELPWPTDAEHCLRSIGGLLPQSIEIFIIYLQSIGGLELVDNHSSHQESNEAGPLAFILQPRVCECESEAMYGYFYSAEGGEGQE